MIPLRSRIAALPGLWPTAFLGCSATVTIAFVLVVDSMSTLGTVGYLIAAFIGAFIGVIGTWMILSPISMSISESNGDPFQEGDMVQVLKGKYKGSKGNVEKTSGSYHDGAYITVNVAGKSTVYGTLDIFLIERLNIKEEKAREEQDNLKKKHTRHEISGTPTAKTREYAYSCCACGKPGEYHTTVNGPASMGDYYCDDHIPGHGINLVNFIQLLFMLGLLSGIGWLVYKWLF